MKKEMLNGTPIPYELPTDELKIMMSSPEMKDFALACEALSYKNDPEAYPIMKSYINDRDKYRRLYIIKTIFRHPEAAELVGLLENAIVSDDVLFVEHGLSVIAEYKIKVSDSLLLSVICKHFPNLGWTAVRSLGTLTVSEDHYVKLKELWARAERCVQKEIIGEILIEKYLPFKSRELFDLFGRDGTAKIRLLALKLANQCGYNISSFLSDIDGHVKKLAMKSLGGLSFLSRYISKYRVDVSDDLESAVIYNPNGQDHLYIEYDRADSVCPYMLTFSFQHVHETDEASAAKWVDGILNEKIFSIEYFVGEDSCLGGQISALDLSNLSYEFLEQYAGYFGRKKLFHMVDSFKVRGWTGKNDFDGCLVKKDGEIHIEMKPRA